MVGNDIIDIEETKRTSDWERPGFMGKIFTSKEQSMIRYAGNPFTTVWRMWSMKESAYKVYIQAGGHRFFNPTKIECQINTSKKGQVTIDINDKKTCFKTSTLIHANYIFSTATLNDADINTSIFELTDGDLTKQSNYIKAKALNEFAKDNHLNRAALAIQKAKNGVPKLHYQNKILKTAVSITHHGKYGAYSIKN